MSCFFLFLKKVCFSINSTILKSLTVITKILASRLRDHLGDMVNSNQTAFVNGRNMPENILLAHKLVKGYHRNKGLGRCAIKVDLRKAYDSTNWNFILMCLLAVGCPPKFVNWVRICITSPRYSIAFNGSLVGYFKGGKGLDKGIPYPHISLSWQWKDLIR